MNRLQYEKSPYLQQHKANPVDWYPWGDEAFKKAKELNKPIFLSIGYSTCYWCHVMEKESFETNEVGNALLDGFISIKVDREERPDVDELYMNAVVSMLGHGGWPMSVFLTPDLKPFWGGTYFPQNQFLQILRQIKDSWNAHKEELIGTAEKLTSFMIEKRSLPAGNTVSLEKIEEHFWKQFNERFDSEWGGFNGAPKFPPHLQLATLLRINHIKSSKEIEHAIELTLKRMANGGIFDHAGGGFSRYSVDEKWSVPHFEKMLYDNALLANLYFEASTALSLPVLKDIGNEILMYLLSVMKSPSGGFYAAEDAGEVGKEGEFYIWKWKELEEILSDEEFEALKNSYLISEEGNFEKGENVLHFADDKEWGLRFRSPLRNALQALRLYREANRARPHRDEKIIASWNALALLAFIKGYEVTQLETYFAAARGIADCLKKNLMTAKTLFRSFCVGESKHHGCLEDYSLVALAFLRLYEISGDEESLQISETLLGRIDEYFLDSVEGNFYSSNAPELVMRQKDFFDGVLPSGNSVMLELFARLSVLFPEAPYAARYAKLKESFNKIFETYPMGAPRAVQAVQFVERNPSVLVYSREKSSEISSLRAEQFLPSVIVVKASENGPPITRGKSEGGYFLCSNGACRLPTQSLSELKRELK